MCDFGTTDGVSDAIDFGTVGFDVCCSTKWLGLCVAMKASGKVGLFVTCGERRG